MTPDQQQPEPTPALAELVVPSYTPKPSAVVRVIFWGKIIVVSLIVLVVVCGLWGNARWVKATDVRLNALAAATPGTRPERFYEEDLDTLPPVVKRYMEQALNLHQPLVRGVYLEQTGTFNLSATGESWSPFTARQSVYTKRPGFVWDAKINSLFGLPVRVHDAYVAGEGALQPSVLGLFDFGGAQGKGEIARGEFIRYAAESVWYPSVLLPTQGTVWKAVDEHSATATFTDGPLSVTLLFSFNDKGLVERISSTERSALIDGKLVPMPWEVRLSNYQEHSGMYVPMAAEVAWITPAGPKPYFRGKVETLDYDMPR